LRDLFGPGFNSESGVADDQDNGNRCAGRRASSVRYEHPASGAFVKSFIAAIAKHRFAERPDLDAIVA
jgi:hypothetical protein